MTKEQKFVMKSGSTTRSMSNGRYTTRKNVVSSCRRKKRDEKLTDADKAFDLKASQAKSANLLHAREVEEAVIGQMFAFRECQPEIFRRMNVAMFYKNDLKVIFDVAKQLYDEGNPVDRLTVAHKIHTFRTLEGAEGTKPTAPPSGREEWLPACTRCANMMKLWSEGIGTG